MNMYAKLMPPDPFRQTDPRLAAYNPPEPPGLTWADSYSVLVKVHDTLRWIIARFWSPGAFALLDSIMRSQKNELLTWLRPLETILRRFFLIEAHALAATLPEPTPRASSRTQTAATSNTKAITDDPLTWLARFNTRVSAAAPFASHNDTARLVHSRTNVRYRARKDDDCIAARPLAMRVEALVRAIIDPMTHIRRLARQIRRHGAPTFAPLLAPQACEVPSLRRALTLVSHTAASLFSVRGDSS